MSTPGPTPMDARAVSGVNYEIRPMSLAELLDAGFQLLKNRFALLGGLSLLGQIPSVILFSSFGWMMDPFAFQGGQMPEIGALFFVGMGLYLLAMFLLMPFVIGSITAAVGDLYLGAPVTFGSALQKGLKRMVPLLVTYIVFTIVTVVGVSVVIGAAALVVVGISVALQGSAIAGVLAVIAIAVAVPVFICLVMLLGFLPGILAAVVVLEKESLFVAVMRTFTLVGATFWRTTGVAVTVYLLVMIAPAGTQFMVGAIPIVGSMIWGAVQALCQAYLFATAVVVYFDIRCRLESFDLEHLAQMVEGAEPSAITS